MFGLGAQEILLLGCCGTLPVVATVIALIAVRSTRSSGPPRTPNGDDFDDD